MVRPRTVELNLTGGGHFGLPNIFKKEVIMTDKAAVEPKEEVKAENGKKATLKDVTPLSVSLVGTPLKTALDVLFGNTFGNQVNKQIYSLQKELIPPVEEYSHLRDQIAKDPKNVNGQNFSEKGLKELVALNMDVGSKQIVLKTELPIKVKFLDCFTSNDRIILETIGICEFED